jgi:hypothetical protein
MTHAHDPTTWRDLQRDGFWLAVYLGALWLLWRLLR